MAHPEIIRFLEKQTAEILGDNDEMTQFTICLTPAGAHYGRIEYLTPIKAYVRFTIGDVTLEQYAFAQAVPLGTTSYLELHAERDRKSLSWNHVPQILPKGALAIEEVLGVIFDEARYEVFKVLVALKGPLFTASATMTVEEQISRLNSAVCGPYLH